MTEKPDPTGVEEVDPSTDISPLEWTSDPRTTLEHLFMREQDHVDCLRRALRTP